MLGELDELAKATAGGLLIGLASAAVLVLKGRVAGISGIFSGVLQGPREAWRTAFVIGLLLGGLALGVAFPAAISSPTGRSLPIIALAGFVVGFGTRHGNGCTSGHGICGLGRFSKRSAAATATFMATGFVTASLLHVLGASA